MMYKSFPFLSEAERINKNTETQINPDNLLNPISVFKNNSIQNIDELRLNYLLNRPVYHLTSIDGISVSKYADNGQPLLINRLKAKTLAANATGNVHASEVEKMEELDQWVPRVKYLKHLPIYNVKFDDNENTRVYISSLSGEVISLTTNSDRFWAWIGAIPHWIYFRNIRIHRDIWAQLVSWLAGLGFLMALTGIITGFTRSRKKPKAKSKRFKNKWYNYHYYLGLTFGLFVCTWVFSGFMSMTPFKWIPSTVLSQQNVVKWQKSEFKLNSFSNDRWDSFLKQTAGKKIQESNFCLYNNTLFTRTHSNTSTILISLDQFSYTPDLTDYKNSISTFFPTDSIVETLILSEYDNYYYSRQHDKSLPIIRISTASNLAYYIDPKTTEMVYKCATKNRVERWIYHGLHSFDFAFLTSKGILRDIIMIFLLLGGTGLSLTATGLGIKFIRRKVRKRLKKIRNG